MKLISAILCFSVLALAAAGNFLSSDILVKLCVCFKLKKKMCDDTSFKRDVIYE